MNPSEVTARLEALRRSEKRQALTYRSLAGQAESLGEESVAQRFHDLHADEQHHLSRLTARILELGGRPADLADVAPDTATLEGWEELVRARETREITDYRDALTLDLDADSIALIEEILAVEVHHLAELGGKWTMA